MEFGLKYKTNLPMIITMELVPLDLDLQWNAAPDDPKGV